MNLQYFWKNVNKQLKSADFLSEILKFQKIHINKVFAFFNLSSKHTLICVAQTPNTKSLMSIYCLNCWWARTFYNIFKNFVNKKFLNLSLEYTLNSAGNSANFDFSGPCLPTTHANLCTFVCSCCPIVCQYTRAWRTVTHYDYFFVQLLQATYVDTLLLRVPFSFSRLG